MRQHSTRRTFRKIEFGLYCAAVLGAVMILAELAGCVMTGPPHQSQYYPAP